MCFVGYALLRRYCFVSLATALSSLWLLWPRLPSVSSCPHSFARGACFPYSASLFCSQFPPVAPFTCCRLLRFFFWVWFVPLAIPSLRVSSRAAIHPVFASLAPFCTRFAWRAPLGCFLPRLSCFFWLYADLGSFLRGCLHCVPLCSHFSARSFVREAWDSFFGRVFCLLFLRLLVRWP